jgi:hypothetical protein
MVERAGQGRQSITNEQRTKNKRTREQENKRTREQENKSSSSNIQVLLMAQGTSGVSGFLSHNNTVADQTKKYIFSNEIHREQGREASKVGKQGRQARQSRTKEKRENT